MKTNLFYQSFANTIRRITFMEDKRIEQNEKKIKN